MCVINIYIYYIGIFSVFSLKSKFLLYYPKKLEKYPKKSLATLRGVAGPHPIFGKN